MIIWLFLVKFISSTSYNNLKLQATLSGTVIFLWILYFILSPFLLKYKETITAEIAVAILAKQSVEIIFIIYSISSPFYKKAKYNAYKTLILCFF